MMIEYGHFLTQVVLFVQKVGVAISCNPLMLYVLSLLLDKAFMRRDPLNR